METIRIGAEGLEPIRKRFARASTADAAVERSVADILAAVRERGDAALRELSQRFGDATYTGAPVPAEVIERACAGISPDLRQALEMARGNIEAFHRKQMPRSWFDAAPNGAILGQMIRPLDTVGLYVPGGTAAYPSTVLMTAVPARVAGVRRVILCSPPRFLTAPLLAAAAVAGVDAVFALGGAQAIAAMAYGTESIPQVDKICGPGNPYVVAAKRQVFGTVGIESLPGPSEILVIADDTARPDWVAADLLSQAEHGGIDGASACVLVTPSERLAAAVDAEVERQLAGLARRQEAEASVRANGVAIVTRTLEEAAGVSNLIAPEHLEVCVAEPWTLLPLLTNAGAILLGHWSAESVADYVAGPSHVLPTGGTARFLSPLSVDDFLKKSSIIQYPEAATRAAAGAILELAGVEGLDAHAEAIRIRLAP